jgi:hypothetical protein
MRGPEPGVVQFCILNGNVVATPDKEQAWAVHFQVCPGFMYLIAGIDVCPECFPIPEAVTIDGAGACDGETIYIVGVDQGCIVKKVLAFHARGDQGDNH